MSYSQSNTSNMQANLHLIVDDISIALKSRLQTLFGELLTKCDEYDVTNEIILSLPIVKRMLNAGSDTHRTTTTATATASTVDDDDCVFIKKEKLDPKEQTCTFNYDSLIGFLPPNIEEDADECGATESEQLKEDDIAPINLALLVPSRVEVEDWSVTDADEDEDEDEEDDADNCYKCKQKILFNSEASYVLSKDGEEVCWCQRCFEVGWNRMHKEGWECDAYEPLEKVDPVLVSKSHQEVNLSLNIEEVEEDETEEQEDVEAEDDVEAEEAEEDVEADLVEEEQDDVEEEQEDVEEEQEDVEEEQEDVEEEQEDVEEEQEDAEEEQEDVEEEQEDAEEEQEDAEEEQEDVEEEQEDVEEEQEDAEENVVEEEEAVTEEELEDEEEEAVTEEELEDEEEEDEEVFEVDIMGKNYYTNNISTGDIYEIDSAGDPGDQVGRYVNGVATFTR